MRLRLGTLKDMLKLHQRVDPTERLVGWYSTWAGGEGPAYRDGPVEGSQVDEFTNVVHEFFDQLATDVRPLHLLVDVSLRTPHVHVHAHRQNHNALLKRCVPTPPAHTAHARPLPRAPFIYPPRAPPPFLPFQAGPHPVLPAAREPRGHR